MLGNKDAAANIAVRNLEIAKKFYENTLGLTQVGAEGQEAIIFKSKNSTVIKPFVSNASYSNLS